MPIHVKGNHDAHADVHAREQAYHITKGTGAQLRLRHSAAKGTQGQTSTETRTDKRDEGAQAGMRAQGHGNAQMHGATQVRECRWGAASIETRAMEMRWPCAMHASLESSRQGGEVEHRQ